MKIEPRNYWPVLDKYTYRLACSRIHFDINHKPLIKSELESLVGEEEVDEDYPKTLQEMQAELSKTVCSGLATFCWKCSGAVHPPERSAEEAGREGGAEPEQWEQGTG